MFGLLKGDTRRTIFSLPTRLVRGKYAMGQRRWHRVLKHAWSRDWRPLASTPVLHCATHRQLLQPTQFIKFMNTGRRGIVMYKGFDILENRPNVCTISDSKAHHVQSLMRLVECKPSKLPTGWNLRHKGASRFRALSISWRVFSEKFGRICVLNFADKYVRIFRAPNPDETLPGFRWYCLATVSRKRDKCEAFACPFACQWNSEIRKKWRRQHFHSSE